VLLVRDTQNFTDLSGLTFALKVSLGLYMAAAAVSLWSGWLEIDLLQRAASGDVVSVVEASASDSRQAFLGGLYIVAFILAGATFLRLILLSSKNARALGAAGMQFTPAWAVGWYFVPVMSIWKPYQAMKEIFKASHPDFDKDWDQAPTPAILPVWWTVWVIVNTLGQAIFRFTLRAESIDELLVSSWLTLVSDAMDLPLGVVAMVVVAKLQTLQSEKHRRHTLSDAALTDAV
jgi:hypothetical protein